MTYKPEVAEAFTTIQSSCHLDCKNFKRTRTRRNHADGRCGGDAHNDVT